MDHRVNPQAAIRAMRNPNNNSRHRLNSHILRIILNIIRHGRLVNTGTAIRPLECITPAIFSHTCECHYTTLKADREDPPEWATRTMSNKDNKCTLSSPAAITHLTYECLCHHLRELPDDPEWVIRMKNNNVNNSITTNNRPRHMQLTSSSSSSNNSNSSNIYKQVVGTVGRPPRDHLCRLTVACPPVPRGLPQLVVMNLPNSSILDRRATNSPYRCNHRNNRDSRQRPIRLCRHRLQMHPRRH
jgi:hypothetical protein